jgi:hypothetical protein
LLKGTARFLTASETYILDGKRKFVYIAKGNANAEYHMGPGPDFRYILA